MEQKIWTGSPFLRALGLCTLRIMAVGYSWTFKVSNTAPESRLWQDAGDIRVAMNIFEGVITIVFMSHTPKATNHQQEAQLQGLFRWMDGVQ